MSTIGDRVLETASNPGTGTVTLLGAVTGYRTFASVITANETPFPYVIAGGANWETGIGIRASATTFNRTVLTSSNSNALVNFTGTVEVWIDATQSYLDPLRSRSDNLVINGGMEMDQQNEGNVISIPNNTNTYVLDQWTVFSNTTGATTLTGQRLNLGSSLPLPPSLGQALWINTTAGGTIASAGDFRMFRTPIEGRRWRALSFSGSAAVPVTFTFWTLTTLTGVATLFVQNDAQNRSYVINFTCNGGSWEFHCITVPGDAAGSWSTGTGAGAYVGVCLGAGATFQGSQGSWLATNTIATSSTSNFFATLSNIVGVTGFTAFAGNFGPNPISSSYIKRTKEEEEWLCQRYFEKSMPMGTAPATNLGLGSGENAFPAVTAGATSQKAPSVRFRVKKKGPPVVVIYNSNNTNNEVRDTTANADCSATAITQNSDDGFYLSTTGAAGTAVGNRLAYGWAASSRM